MYFMDDSHIKVHKIKQKTISLYYSKRNLYIYSNVIIKVSDIIILRKTRTIKRSIKPFFYNVTGNVIVRCLYNVGDSNECWR